MKEKIYKKIAAAVVLLSVLTVGAQIAGARIYNPTGSSGSGTVTSVATNNGLTGGTITTTGTLGLDTSGLSTNAVVSWNGSKLVATGTPQLTVGNLISTTSAASEFVGPVGFNILTPTAQVQISSTTPSFLESLFDISTTTANGYGDLFSVNATSSVLALGATANVAPEQGVRVTVGNPNPLSFGGPLDQLTVNGRVNTEGWNNVSCDKASNSGGSSSISNVCGPFSIAIVSGATYKSTNSNTGGYAYDSVTIPVAQVAGAGAVFNSGTTSGGNGWLVPATSTPVMEVNARINTAANATSSIFYIGFDNNAVTTPVVTTPTDGCYFTASSTSAGVGDWWAVAVNGSTFTYKDTGIASSTSATTAGGFRKFRIEADNTHCAFYIQQNQTSALNQVANITTNVPATKGLNAAVWLTQVTVSSGASYQLDFNHFRVWWRDFLPAL